MVGFLDEKEGVKSSMRLMNVISLLIVGALALIPLWKGAPADMSLILMFLSGAFAPKIIQKYME